MEYLDMVGYYRKDLGRKASKDLRTEGYAPCVLYGGHDEPIHFYVPMILFRELVYTPDVKMVVMDIEGTEYKCILQDITFHPVSEVILHVDFLRLYDDVPVKMDIPVSFKGSSPGLLKGGKLVTKTRKLTVKALPADMPQSIEVSIEGLELGKSVKVSSIKQDNFTILNNPMVTIGSIEIPRALKSAKSKEA
ncbi:50S ribosomal protein L25/general stress protein Ctc [Chondrinema litorale]|uniref:50S ribosomal protein L25/general stress protein Ctc n=1 Tax=Chondrinema litorale TaxID=2994555 RepID=UPI0025446A3B|nr:50S ribosomal protein L25/general stress protein Ctc [Chondrinema litorale]UZR93188.1 50S ribosomal protein L25/general stress protein Ctc [Chondrinema litorale]